MDNWIDLFSFGCNGYKYNPTEKGRFYYYNDGAMVEKYDISKTDYDFGWYNKISNGGNQIHQWRMFRRNEIEYLLEKRTNAEQLVMT